MFFTSPQQAISPESFTFLTHVTVELAKSSTTIEEYYHVRDFLARLPAITRLEAAIEAVPLALPPTLQALFLVEPNWRAYSPTRLPRGSLERISQSAAYLQTLELFVLLHLDDLEGSLVKFTSLNSLYAPYADVPDVLKSTANDSTTAAVAFISWAQAHLPKRAHWRRLQIGPVIPDAYYGDLNVPLPTLESLAALGIEPSPKVLLDLAKSGVDTHQAATKRINELLTSGILSIRTQGQQFVLEDWMACRDENVEFFWTRIFTKLVDQLALDQHKDPTQSHKEQIAHRLLLGPAPNGSASPLLRASHATWDFLFAHPHQFYVNFTENIKSYSLSVLNPQYNITDLVELRRRGPLFIDILNTDRSKIVRELPWEMARHCIFALARLPDFFADNIDYIDAYLACLTTTERKLSVCNDIIDLLRKLESRRAVGPILARLHFFWQSSFQTAGRGLMDSIILLRMMYYLGLDRNFMDWLGILTTWNPSFEGKTNFLHVLCHSESPNTLDKTRLCLNALIAHSSWKMALEWSLPTTDADSEGRFPMWHWITDTLTFPKHSPVLLQRILEELRTAGISGPYTVDKSGLPAKAFLASHLSKLELDGIRAHKDIKDLEALL